MITIPTTLATANLIAAEHPDATVTMTADRITVLIGAVEFVATTPEPWTAFPHGYLSRRAAS